MNFLDIEIDKKNYIRLLIASIVLVVVILAFYYSSLLIFKPYKVASTTIESDEGMNTHIDMLECQGKKLEIAGWAYKEGEELVTLDSSYVIKNRETGKMYLMRTKDDKNINLLETEYSDAGMHAQCLFIGLPKGTYDIYVLYRNNDNDQLVNTKIFFSI